MAAERLPLIARAALPALFILLAPALPAEAQDTVFSLSARVDELDAAGSYQEAVALLRPALRENPGEYALLWRMSEELCDWARIGPEPEMEPRYGEAVSFARAAVQARPDHSQGHFQLGKALGRMALFKGGKEKVNLSKEVKEAFERAIALDPAHHLAIHGLARWHREVANLSWLLKTAAKIIYGGLPPASNEEAVTLFQRAVGLEPGYIAHHLELGKTYLETREKERAAAEFQKCLELPASHVDDPEWKQEAEELLGRIVK